MSPCNGTGLVDNNTRVCPECNGNPAASDTCGLEAIRNSPHGKLLDEVEKLIDTKLKDAAQNLHEPAIDLTKSLAQINEIMERLKVQPQQTAETLKSSIIAALKADKEFAKEIKGNPGDGIKPQPAIKDLDAQTTDIAGIVQKINEILLMLRKGGAIK